MLLTELENYSGSLLECGRFKDYAPNGLQVEGKPDVFKIITGVSASQALIDEAIRRQADAILVHHGWFWKSEDPRIIRTKKSRLAALIRADISLLAYHLPLDAHPALGNNAQLALRLGLIADGRFGDQDIGWLGVPDSALDLAGLGLRIETALQRKPLLIGNPSQPLRRIAWCTGGADSWFQQAIDQGVDAFITGEASEPVFHLAQETGVAFIAAGHHATERYGILALGDQLAQHFGVTHEFIELTNPI